MAKKWLNRTILQDLSVLNEIIDNVSPNLSFIDVDVNHVDEDDDEKWKRAFVENMEKCINLFCIWDCAWIWIRIRDIYCINYFGQIWWYCGRWEVWPDWVIYCTLGNFLKPVATIILPKLPTFLGNFCKGVKIFLFFSWNHFGQLL